MTPMEISLLIIGVIIFLAGFFVKDKPVEKTELDREVERDEIRRMLDRELDGMTLKVNDATNSSIEYAMEKSERSLEKITNEKIMAISEYATTILEDINKSHKEVMFLYDMLTDKQIDIKNTVRKVEATTKDIESDNTDKNDGIVISVETLTNEQPKSESVAKPKKKNTRKKVAAISENKEKNNSKIIELHKQGRSNIEIARELNLGVGEVTLIIDLYER